MPQKPTKSPAGKGPRTPARVPARVAAKRLKGPIKSAVKAPVEAVADLSQDRIVAVKYVSLAEEWVARLATRSGSG